MKYTFYITLFIGLIFGCRPALDKTEHAMEKVEDTEPVELTTKTFNKVEGCLSKEDLDFIQGEVLAIEKEIQKGNDEALVQRIRIGKDRNVGSAEMEELLGMVKEYFSKELMTEEYQGEAKTEKRFVPSADPSCERYLIIQNFATSEFSYVFIMSKASDKLAFHKIEVIG